MELTTAVEEGLSGAFSTYADRVRQLSEPLSDEQFWTKPYAYGNSFGHLVLHVTGNLNTYIGAQIAGTGYVRDREREFTEQARPSKDEVLRNFAAAVAMVTATIEAQTDEGLMKMPEDSAGTHFSNRSRFGVFLHCAAHLNHHVGQMIYLEKELDRTAS